MRGGAFVRDTGIAEIVAQLAPSMVTVAGLACGIVGLAHYPSPASVVLFSASLFCDLIDGWLARELHTVSELGAELDWHVDVALAHVAGWLILGPWLMLALVTIQALMRARKGVRVSGRAAVFVAAIALEVFGWWT